VGGLSPWTVGSTFAYDNPYYDASSYAPEGVTNYTVPQALDYSEPIPETSDTEAENTDQDVVDDAMNHFNLARAYFKKGMYANATAEVEQALAELPGDRSMHEFLALSLFARGRYQAAAGALYAVLAGGPGMDWNTLAGLYPNTETYTAQLRRLADYVGKHPKDTSSRFLLAYHYLVLNDRDAALTELRTVTKLRPDDKLSAQLAQALAQQPREEMAVPDDTGQPGDEAGYDEE
jgi:tetratricopeptide (TPR) repeat protein